VEYGSTRTAETEVAAMVASPDIEQLTRTIESLSDEDIERLAKVVRTERKRRGLKTSKSGETDQGGQKRGKQAP
jgi:hypothetical protein